MKLKFDTPMLFRGPKILKDTLEAESSNSGQSMNDIGLEALVSFLLTKHPKLKPVADYIELNNQLRNLKG